MESLLSKKHRALEAAVWPLGRPSDAHEIPMWQSVCQNWVEQVVQPTHVTYLIEELREKTDDSDPDTTAYDITQAVENTGDWEETARRKGWLSCVELVDELLEPGDHRELLLKLLNLIVHGSSNDEPDDEDLAFYWIRKNPEWNVDNVVFKRDLIAWADMTDTYAGHRETTGKGIEAHTGHVPEYELAHCMLRNFNKPDKIEIRFSEERGLPQGILDTKLMENLPSGEFLPMSRVVDNCRQAVTAWVISEWLGPHGFVSFDNDDWSSDTTWQELGKKEGYDELISRKEICHWYIVSELAGELLRDLGEVVVPLTGSAKFLFGRDETGQVLHFDGSMTNAMIMAGHVDRIPPLGALNHDERVLPRIKISLGGDEFPFRVYGYSEQRPDRELDGVILEPSYREHGWCVIWGPSYQSESEGLVRMFKLSPVTPEGHPEPEYHEG